MACWARFCTYCGAAIPINDSATMAKFADATGKLTTHTITLASHLKFFKGGLTKYKNFF